MVSNFFDILEHSVQMWRDGEKNILETWKLLLIFLLCGKLVVKMWHNKILLPIFYLRLIIFEN